MKEDAIIVDDFIFWDFGQEVTHLVYFRYRKLTQNSEKNDETNIRKLFSQIGLWEDYINIKRIINEEIQIEKNSPELISNYSPDKFDIQFGEHKSVSICTVIYSKNEALRKTEGRKNHTDLSIESLRKYLINLNKWLILKRTTNYYHNKI